MGTQQNKPIEPDALKKRQKAQAIAKAKEVSRGLQATLADDFQNETVAKFKTK